MKKSCKITTFTPQLKHSLRLLPNFANKTNSSTEKFPSLRTTAFPQFQNSRRSERQHFRSFRIPVVPNDSISAVSEFPSLRTTAFPQFQNSRRSERQHFLCKQHHYDTDDGYYGGENAEAPFWQELHQSDAMETVRMASPCTPVFDMPTKMAITKRTIQAQSLCMYAEKSIISCSSPKQSLSPFSFPNQRNDCLDSIRVSFFTLQ